MKNLEYKIADISIEYFRKLKKIEKINVGTRLNVISGHNGVGKSSLLSLLASGSGTNDNRLNNGSFQPEFNDYFKIDPDENYQNYNLDIRYNSDEGKFTKKIDFKDDRNENRGIRPIPRTHVWPGDEGSILVKDAKKAGKEKFNVGDSARVSIPTLYISISRVFPLGETEIKTKALSKNTKIIQLELNKKFKKWYNEVLPNSISEDNDDMLTINKETSKRMDFYMNVEDTSPITQSVGQDNLRNIITALVDFYALSLKDDYKGGILFIDELDTSLHPSAQINLFNLLQSVAKELNLQVFVTSHSLTIIKEIIRLSAKDETLYQLIYLKGTRIPTVATYNDYDTLKADLFQETNAYKPKVKVYCEDKETKEVFELLIQTARDLNIDFSIPDYEVIPVHLGDNHLIQLPSRDQYFTSVLIVLDGDAKSNAKVTLKEYIRDRSIIKGLNQINVSDNIMFNPSYLSPEGYLYTIINDYVINDEKHLTFWRTVERDPDTTNLTSDKIENEILLNESELKNIKSKSEDIISFTKKSKLLEDYYKKQENKDELKNYIRDLEKKFDKVIKTIQSRRF